MQRPNPIDYTGEANRIRQGGTLTGGQYMGAPYNDNYHSFYFTAPYAKTLGDLSTTNVGGMSLGTWALIALGAWFLFGKRR